MGEFTEGRKIKGIFWGGNEPGWLRVEETGTLEVTMEPGHMAMLPWIREVTQDGEIRMHNVALLETVEFVATDTDPVEEVGDA